MITTSNLNEARKEIQKLVKDKNPVIVKAQSNEFNRKIFEIKDVDMVVELEFNQRKDRLKQRDSGLNEILCKLASKNNISIGIDITKLQKLKSKEKAEVISRIIQNIKLCKRTKTKIVLIGKNLTKQDILSFFLTFKGSTQQARLYT